MPEVNVDFHSEKRVEGVGPEDARIAIVGEA